MDGGILNALNRADFPRDGSGAYHITTLDGQTLHRAGFQVVIANPRCTKNYANGFSLAKTDHLDAKMLADYAQALEIKGLVANMLYIPPSEAEEKLEALVKRRSQLVDIRAAEKNRLEQIHESQQQSVKDLIAHLDKLIAELDKDIDSNADAFGGKGQVLTAIKGIGSTTSAPCYPCCPSWAPYHTNASPCWQVSFHRRTKAATRTRKQAASAAEWRCAICCIWQH